MAPGAVPPRLSERPLVVALDIGSSSVRASLFDRDGRPIEDGAVKVDYAWDIGPEGSIRLPHSALLAAVEEALDLLLDTVGPLAREAVAGGISCFFHSLVGLDAAGTPITPVLSWADCTSAAQASALRGRLDAVQVHAQTGAPIHASYWPARVVHLREEYPAVMRWCGFPEILVASLVGRAVVSRSMASGTGLYDRARDGWAANVLASLRIDESELPPLVDDDEVIGRLTGAAADRWPDLASVDWFAPWGDGACNNVGLDATGPAVAALMVGTSGALRVLIDDPAPSLPAGLFSYRLGPRGLLGGQLSEGGGLLSWASRQLHGTPASLERAAAAMSADSHGLTVLPFVFGERGMGYHDHAHGTIAGLGPDTNADAIYRAIVESIAYSFASIHDLLSEVLGQVPAVTVSGGALSRSPLLAQVLADTLGLDITVTHHLEASLRGAALLALQHSGNHVEQSTGSVSTGHIVEHDPGRSVVYQAARRRRQTLYRALLD